MNSVNSIQLDVSIRRSNSTSYRKRIIPIAEFNSATETDKEKKFLKSLTHDLDSIQKHVNVTSELFLSDSKYYRANLLNEIVHKMSGIEPRNFPGQLVEYYA